MNILVYVLWFIFRKYICVCIYIWERERDRQADRQTEGRDLTETGSIEERENCRSVHIKIYFQLFWVILPWIPATGCTNVASLSFGGPVSSQWFMLLSWSLSSDDEELQLCLCKNCASIAHISQIVIYT